MKYLIVLLLSSLLFFNKPAADHPKPAAAATQPVAVVELFTAEGCSSCPAADELLKEMTGILQKEGKKVYALAFHVTYWDHLGWKDPYSNEVFTDRQKLYKKQMSLPQLYTPQAVVNGRFEFVGSNPLWFRKHVETALTDMPTNYTITAAARHEGDSLRVQYSLDKSARAAIVNVALVEGDVEHHVARGENKDKTLKHYHVVRAWESHPAKESEEVALAWPKDMAAGNASVIVYVQHRQSLRLLGGTEATLNQP